MSSLPPSQGPGSKPCVSIINCSEKLVTVGIRTDSTEASAPNDQQLPQSPWSLTGLTLLTLRRSKEAGYEATFPVALGTADARRYEKSIVEGMCPVGRPPGGMVTSGAPVSSAACFCPMYSKNRAFKGATWPASCARAAPADKTKSKLMTTNAASVDRNAGTPVEYGPPQLNFILLKLHIAFFPFRYCDRDAPRISEKGCKKFSIHLRFITERNLPADLISQSRRIRKHLSCQFRELRLDAKKESLCIVISKPNRSRRAACVSDLQVRRLKEPLFAKYGQCTQCRVPLRSDLWQREGARGWGASPAADVRAETTSH